MANIVKLKRSSVVGKVPDAGNIEVGEPAVNLVDKILYTKDTGGNIIVIGSGTTSNVIEGSNLYFTNARAIGAFSEGSGIVIDSNGLISANITLTSSVASVNGQTGTVVLSTANIAENGNLYFTNSRVVSALTAGQNITIDANGRINSTATGGASGASVTVQNTAPNSNTQGTFWLDSDTMDLYVSYSNVWVMVNGSSIPVDVINPLLLSSM